MSKIICEVCGTSYPDTADQCPICGYVNPGKAGASGSSASQNGQSGYHYDKGGHFSKSNVRKRNQARQPVVRNTTTEKIISHDSKSTSGRTPTEDHEESKNKAPQNSGGKSTGLVITTVILLLTIIGIVIYLSVHFFGPDSKLDIVPPTDTSASTLPIVDPIVTQPQVIPCQSVSMNVSSVAFDKAGSSRMVYAETIPENTTDTLVYQSDNEQVATVSQNGMITAVGSGKATITVICGSASAVCEVTCLIPDETEEETTAETTEATETAEGKLSLNRNDMTLSKQGETWNLYDGNIGKTKITWSSGDESVATVIDGVVKAVGGGTTKIYAEYNGEKVSCIVRCSFTSGNDTAINGNGGNISEDGGGQAEPPVTKPQQDSPSGSYEIQSPFGPLLGNSCTISSGDTLNFSLKDSNGSAVDATWAVSGDGCTVSGSTVTGVKSGSSATLSATYNGKTFSCTVYVR